uniref:C-type lectin domain-containing protein n=1 Tax=Anas zonorhyncha TaxID=75864 RepID=A0A8B9UIK9_9AVES
MAPRRWLLAPPFRSHLVTVGLGCVPQNPFALKKRDFGAPPETENRADGCSQPPHFSFCVPSHGCRPCHEGPRARLRPPVHSHPHAIPPLPPRGPGGRSAAVLYGGGCELCPVGWTLHGRKCFWVTSKSSSWRESRENCSHQRAQLLVPEDQGELDFLNRVIQKPTRYFWIGLSQPSPVRAWRGWMGGFNLSTPNASGACGALREDRIISETCGSALAWICQKEAVLL